jgi:hypothetical protein
MGDRLRRVLAAIERSATARGGLRRLALLVAALYSSVLLQGFQVDDLWHRTLLRGSPHLATPRSPWWDLFVFFDGDARRLAQFRAHGFAMWWSDVNLRVAFFRPLSGLTHALDDALWHDAPALMHLHSLAWYLALVAVAAALYREVTSKRAAAVAALLYAVDHTHAGVVAWIGNRNALTAALFGLLAVLLHHRGTRGDARARWASAPALALALLSGESGLAAVAYLGAHALTLDTRPWVDRARSLAPAALVTAAWAAVYRLGHYGTVGAGLYVDPTHNPLRFLAGVPRAMTLMAASEWGGLAPEVGLTLPLAGRRVILVVAIIAVTLTLAGLSRALRTRASTRFMLLGALLAMLPSCGTMPATRLLMLPGFGLVGVVAEALCDLVEGPAKGTLAQRVGLRWVGGWAGVFHLALSPLLLIPLSWQMVMFHSAMEGWANSFAPDDRALTSQRLVVVNAPDVTFIGYTQLIRDHRGETLARSLFTLASGTHPLALTRVSDDALVVHAPGGFYQRDTELLTRDLYTAMPAGTRVEVPDITVEVLRTTPRGVPDLARFTFAGGLDDARYRWTQWQGRHLVPFALPAVGQRVYLEGHLLEL